LFIDPQGEANKWLKQKEKSKEVKILRFSDPHYLKALQNAISSGYAALIEEVDERLEPSLDSVLQKQIMNVDGRKLIRVGDKRVDFNSKFMLYLTTKMQNPHYLPEVFIKVTIINFCITFEGLQDQLLGEVMKHERPEIEKQRDEIIVSIAGAKKSLKQA
jgi:dynein heavy chain, axonemal